MWDTAGQERFRTITQSYYKGIIYIYIYIGANGIIIAYDVTDRNSFNNLDNWLQQVEANGKTGLVVVIAGNKIDLREQRQVTYEEGFVYIYIYIYIELRPISEQKFRGNFSEDVRKYRWVI